jgi:hypothetical protein
MRHDLRGVRRLSYADRQMRDLCSMVFSGLSSISRGPDPCYFWYFALTSSVIFLISAAMSPVCCCVAPIIRIMS